MSEQSFEGELKKLEVCVEELGKPNIPLNESLDNFEKGVSLFRDCQDFLDQAKQKVVQLQEAPPKMDTQPKSNFEDALKLLERCVEELGKPNIPLNEALGNFEKGVSLFRECQEQLQHSKQKVIELKMVGGSIKETPQSK